MIPQNFMALTVKAVPENVGLARLTVAVFASNLPFTVAEVDEVKVAVSEAVTNAVIHAYPDGDGTVEIRAEIADGQLMVAVIDTGVGIADIERARQNGYSSDPERLGMGFYFMEELMDSIDVESEPGRGTRIIMWRRPEEADPQHEDPQPAVG